MARDSNRAATISQQLEALVAAGVDAAELVVDPSPVDAEALRSRGGSGTPACGSLKV